MKIFKHFALCTLHFAICTLFILSLSSCGQEPASTGAGSIGFSLAFQKPDASQVHNMKLSSATGDPCQDFGVLTIRGKIRNAANQEVTTGGPWQCTDHHGTFEKVPVGSGYKAEFEGIVEGGVVEWHGEQPNLTVIEDQDTPIPAPILMVYEGSAPIIIEVTPANNAANVLTSTTITAEFDEDMLASTINSGTFTVKQGITYLAGTIAYDAATKTASFVPASNLAYSTTYVAMITTGVADTSNDPMKFTRTWSFTTQIAPPGVVSNITTTATDRQVALSWPPVSGAVSYTVYWSSSSAVSSTTYSGSFSTTVPSYPHTSLTNGTQYYYVITATNTTGEGGDSSVKGPLVPGVSPLAPTGVIAAPGTSTSIVISWSTTTGATSYNIYWSTASNVTKTNGTKIAAVTSPYTHSNRTGGTTYYYIVTSVNAYGESAASIQASSAPAAITAPVNVAASAGNQQNVITWNNVTNAVSYNIYWSFSPGVTTSTGTKIANATSPYTQTALTNGAAYYYVVTAVNAGALESAPSTEVYATPSNEPPVLP